MPMNLSWLDDFLALSTSGNFSRAAEERHMTQPAFSRRIRALEEWLGTDLFDRSRQPATLTPAGKWFRDEALELLSQVARLPGEARAVAGSHSASLRFASTHALSFTFLPGWLRGLKPQGEIGPLTLVSDVLTRCEAMLSESKVQFVMCHAHPRASSKLQADNFPSVCVGMDQLLPLTAPGPDGRPLHMIDHAAASAPLRLLGYSEESGIGRIIREVNAAFFERVPVQDVFKAHLASALRTMALDGAGMAWLPRTLVREDVEAGRLVPAIRSEWRIDVEIRLYRDKAPLGASGDNLWATICANASP
ncbi:LysR family transcriptional regulator [Ramlibacter sp. AN1015]|uniref:LysR family transcriptional regulator n=1 Tax=Ramlibacter sp. AN1015 TaxID=3133428 RepID=UPI0030C56DB1